MTDVQISATEFKKHFLSLVNDVREKSENHQSFFGSMKGTVKINDDIVSYSSEADWEANNKHVKNFTLNQ